MLLAVLIQTPSYQVSRCSETESSRIGVDAPGDARIAVDIGTKRNSFPLNDDVDAGFDLDCSGHFVRRREVGPVDRGVVDRSAVDEQTADGRSVNDDEEIVREVGKPVSLFGREGIPRPIEFCRWDKLHGAMAGDPVCQVYQYVSIKLIFDDRKGHSHIKQEATSTGNDS